VVAPIQLLLTRASPVFDLESFCTPVTFDCQFSKRRAGIFMEPSTPSAPVKPRDEPTASTSRQHPGGQGSSTEASRSQLGRPAPSGKSSYNDTVLASLLDEFAQAAGLGRFVHG